MMSSVRKRRSMTSLNGGDLATSIEKEKIIGFSDDEDFATEPKERSESSVNHALPPDLGGADLMSEDSAHSHFTAEGHEVENDIDIFSRAVHISNIDKIDHAKLLNKMHERFKKKVTKWESLAHSYAQYSFVMNFAILLLQILQMVLHQSADLWMRSDKEVKEAKKSGRSFLQQIGIYKLSEWSNTTEESVGVFYGFLDALFTPQLLQTLHSILTALTALIAGLQLKLKLTEKAERYRRGAKVYGRLLRVSSYYIMMIESGGKIEDVTGLWREAMKKEGKWIPLVRTYTPL